MEGELIKKELKEVKKEIERQTIFIQAQDMLLKQLISVNKQILQELQKDGNISRD